MLSLISNTACFPAFLLCPVYQQILQSSGMHLTGRMWRAGEICPGCKAVTGPRFWWFSRPYCVPCRDDKDPLCSQKLCSLWGFSARRFCCFYDRGAGFGWSSWRWCRNLFFPRLLLPGCGSSLLSFLLQSLDLEMAPHWNKRWSWNFMAATSLLRLLL